MDFFYWNKSFEIGIAEIDLQHRRLVDLINELATAITEGGTLPDVQSLFMNLMDYAATHFSDEEKLLAACSLSAAEKAGHLKAHHGFVEKAQEIAANPHLLHMEASERVLEFLTTWLISHILGTDRKIAEAQRLSAPNLAPGRSRFEIPAVESVLLGALTETERRFRLISDQSPVLMWVADASGVRSYFNRIWTDYVGADDEPDDESEWHEFIHPDDRATYLATLSNIDGSSAATEAEYRLRNRDGDYRWFLEKILPRIDGNNAFLGLIASATDISAIKAAEAVLSRANQELEREVERRTAQLEELMMTDPLTGVGNRRLLTKCLADETVRAQRYQRPLSAIFLDLDHFKQINDEYGHAVGDLVLTEFAEIVRSCVRDCDLVGRFGGEEFVVLLPETGIEDAMRIAERIRVALAERRIGLIQRAITVSAGVSELIAGESGESLLKRSDEALYHAKDAGRNCCRVGAAAHATN